jgi:hypothetical protein
MKSNTLVYYMYFVCVVLLLSLLLSKSILNYFNERPYYEILKLFLIGIILNICILGYLLFVFKHIEPLEGQPGPQGESGIKGPSGIEDVCSNGCDKEINTLGDKFINTRKDEDIVVRTPVIDPNIKEEPL